MHVLYFTKFDNLKCNHSNLSVYFNNYSKNEILKILKKKWGWTRLVNRPVYSRVPIAFKSTRLFDRDLLSLERAYNQKPTQRIPSTRPCAGHAIPRDGIVFFFHSYKRFDIQSRRTTSARSNENGNKTYKTRTLIEAINTSYCRYQIWTHDCIIIGAVVHFFSKIFSVHFVHNFSPTRFSRETFCRLIKLVKFE